MLTLKRLDVNLYFSFILRSRGQAGQKALLLAKKKISNNSSTRKLYRTQQSRYCARTYDFMRDLSSRHVRSATVARWLVKERYRR